MSHLSVEFVKRYCVFMIRIEEPLPTMERLMDFLGARRIIVESLNLQMTEGGDARLLIYCLIEKDRISHTRYALEKMRGILELQLLENKESNTMKHER